ncbi:MAG: flagellar biosynthesis protein FlgN [Treponema sp.]|nr:flagellar biosynthesis protein FlgN [Treponema sp.]
MAITIEAGSPPQLSEAELGRRVAVLKRFRELLIRQRERFSNYLEVLEKQQNVIASGSAEDLLSHVEMEEGIVADIFTLQKVIDPLEAMYRAISPGAPGSSTPGSGIPGDDVPALKAALEGLKNQAVARSGRNRELLSARMAEIRGEITALRNNPFAQGARRSLYQNSPSLVDIRG